MRETYTEIESVKYAENLKWEVRKAIYAGRRGAPDRWFMKHGILLLVEFKKQGRAPDGLQIKEHGKLNNAGFYVHVIDNFADFKKLLDKYEECIENSPNSYQPKIRL